MEKLKHTNTGRQKLVLNTKILFYDFINLFSDLIFTLLLKMFIKFIRNTNIKDRFFLNDITIHAI